MASEVKGERLDAGSRFLTLTPPNQQKLRSTKNLINRPLQI